MTRDDLMDRARDALLVAAKRNGRRVAVSRIDVCAAMDVVLDAVLAEVTPVVERSWEGGEVLARIRKLRAVNHRRAGT